jgi:DNA polymerase III subunit epsilon
MTMFGLFHRRKTLGVDVRTGISDANYVVIDSELTGLDERRDAILSLGAVHMTGGKIEIGDAFYRLVSPDMQLTPENVIIHEIMPSDVEAKPSIDVVLAEFLEFCGDRILVGHFAAIDLAFLDRDAKRHRGAPIGNAVIDTYSIYEWLRKRYNDHPCLSTPGLRSKLYDIAKCFGVPVGSAHNALMDAYTTAQLFQRFIPLVLGAGVRDLGDLLKIGIPFKGGERTHSGEISNF